MNRVNLGTRAINEPTKPYYPPPNLPNMIWETPPLYACKYKVKR